MRQPISSRFLFLEMPAAGRFYVALGPALICISGTLATCIG